MGSAFSPQDWDNDRSARNRKFKMVGKSALVLKEDYSDSDNFPTDKDNDIFTQNLKEENSVKIADDQIAIATNTTNANGKFRNDRKLIDNLVKSKFEELATFNEAKYARLINDKQLHSADDRVRNDSYATVDDNSAGIIIGLSLLVIVVGSVSYVIKRERKAQVVVVV